MKSITYAYRKTYWLGDSHELVSSYPRILGCRAFPSPQQEVIELKRGVVIDPMKNVGEPSFRIDIFQFCRGGERVNRGNPFTAPIGAAGPVPASGHDTAERALSGVGGQADSAVSRNPVKAAQRSGM